MRNALAEISLCHEEFGTFFSEVFDQLGSMSDDLAARRKQWHSARQQTEDEFHQRADRLQKEQAALAEVQQRLQRSAGEDRDGMAVAIENVDQLTRILDEMRQEQEGAHDTQEAVQAQLARLAAVAAELAEAQGKLAEGGTADPEAGSQLEE
ncbi:MAG: hypothetical protein JXB62_17745, partial [Pirellulales bacterium]|nr:hypothetical protein [Pirellulales bacterium]